MFFILLSTFFNFKPKIDPKMCTFKNSEEIQKTWKKFLKKKIGNPAFSIVSFF